MSESLPNIVLPGYEDIVLELSTLISGYPPPFIYINDPEALQTTTSVIGDVLSHLSNTLPSESEPGSSKICYGRADMITCFSARLLYESIIHSLVEWIPDWEDGCANWSGGSDLRWNENMDAFLHGLRVAHAYLCDKHGIGTEKAKGKEKGVDYDGLRIVIVVEHAERLKDNLPELVVPLTRLNELSQLDLSVIFVSDVGWENIKPPLGASPDPYFIDILPQSKENIIKQLMTRFPSLSSSAKAVNLYHPSLNALYTHFVTILCDVCYPYTHDYQELAYIAAARWPGFVKPVFDEHRRNHDVEMELESEQPALEIEPPSEDVRLRLTRLFGASLTAALDALYPRLTNAADWAKANEPEQDLLSKTPNEVRANLTKSENPTQDITGLMNLPRMSQFIIIAAFLASTNPAKSDLRMFGRGLDERKRKRRVTKSAPKPKGGVSKIPQRLLGPSPFPLDRLIAILGALLEENDVDSRLPAPEFSSPGEQTDMEISRVAVYAAIMELTSMRLLHRTTRSDQIDGPPMFKCAVSYDITLAFARKLKVPLADLLWEPL